MSRETDELDEALTFAVKHQQHTGHSLTWEKSDLVDGVISIPRRSRWRVECDICDVERIFRDRERAEKFYIEHKMYAGHLPQDPERIELPKLSEIDASDIDSVLDYCFEEAETVTLVPVEAIVEAFEEAGIERKRISEELNVAMSENEVYHLGEGLLAR